MSQSNFKQPTKKAKSGKTAIKANENTAPKTIKQIPKKLNYDSKIAELFVNEQKKLNFSEYILLAPENKKTNENINTINSRKISENYDSYDDTKSVSSLKTNSSVKYKTPKKTKTGDFKTKYKTEMCKYWQIEKSCKYGDNVIYDLIQCAFAHGNDDVKQRHTWSSYKTKKCNQFYTIGYCPYGNRCQFKHSQNEYFSYKRLISLNDSNSINRSRLSIFQTISVGSESTSSYLEEAMKIKNEEDTADEASRSRGSSF